MKKANFLREILIAGVLALFLATPALSAKKELSGTEIFQQYCASCHVAGGNIVKPSKSLVSSKKLGTFALFKAFLNSPTGHMPYYQNLCKNDKLLKSLYKYVKTLESVKIKQAARQLDRNQS